VLTQVGHVVPCGVCNRHIERHDFDRGTERGALLRLRYEFGGGTRERHRKAKMKAHGEPHRRSLSSLINIPRAVTPGFALLTVVCSGGISEFGRAYVTRYW